MMSGMGTEEVGREGVDIWVEFELPLILINWATFRMELWWKNHGATSHLATAATLTEAGSSILEPLSVLS